LIHDLNKKALTKFSKSVIKKFPINYLTRYNRIYGMLELDESRFLLYTHFNHIMVDTEQKVPEYSKVISNAEPKSDTRTMNWNETLSHYHSKYMSAIQNSEGNTHQASDDTKKEMNNFRIDNRFKGIMHMGLVPESVSSKTGSGKKKHSDASSSSKVTLLVVENLWKNLADRLPGVLKVHKFGQ
jgi:hypothetical protein